MSEQTARLCACGHHAGYHTAGGRCTHHACFGATAPCAPPATDRPAPRVIEPLNAVERAAFEIVERVVRRDLGRLRGLIADSPRDVTLELSASGYVRVLVGSEGVRTWLADKSLAEAFEAARAVERRR